MFLRGGFCFIMWYFKALGKRKIFEFILFVIFIIFFMGPILNLVILAFTGQWQYPNILPQSWSLDWWSMVFSEKELVKSIGLSFLIATVVTVLSNLICIPAAYAFARMYFPLSRVFLFSF